MDLKKIEACCESKPSLINRPLVGVENSESLAAVFKLLANGTRLRILHAIFLTEEICVSHLAEKLGMRPTAVSNQLQRLTLSGIIASRRDGNQIFYRIIDPCVVKLIDSAWCLFEESEKRASEMLKR